MYYQSLISGGDLSTSTIRDYAIVVGLRNGIPSQAMQDIVSCESGYKQFNPKGKPLISPTSDVGVMQINQTHWKEAKKLGLDIFNSPIDNIDMGMVVYKNEGLSAWSCYKPVPNDS